MCRHKTQTAPGEKIRRYGISWVGRVDKLASWAVDETGHEKRARKTQSYVEGLLKVSTIPARRVEPPTSHLIVQTARSRFGKTVRDTEYRLPSRCTRLSLLNQNHCVETVRGLPGRTEGGCRFRQLCKRSSQRQTSRARASENHAAVMSVVGPPLTSGTSCSSKTSIEMPQVASFPETAKCGRVHFPSAP